MDTLNNDHVPSQATVSLCYTVTGMPGVDANTEEGLNATKTVSATHSQSGSKVTGSASVSESGTTGVGAASSSLSTAGAAIPTGFLVGAMGLINDWCCRDPCDLPSDIRQNVREWILGAW
ncbi:hypothetical protein WAI453_005159 [Rhynchosporium graminicola]